MAVVANKTIGEIVAEDYRTAQVFRNHSIDFCCQGNRSIEAACDGLTIEPRELIHEIEIVKQETKEASIDYQSWPLDLLTDYIEKKHHRYVEETVPILKQYLEKLCRVHGNRHPELVEITALFTITGGEFAKHMKKEELILFPFIRKMVKRKAGEQLNNPPYFGSVTNPVEMMMHEHAAEGERFRKIASLSDNYTAPADGCGTYRVTFALLKEFEEDMHLLVHLENNILFPNAIALEKN